MDEKVSAMRIVLVLFAIFEYQVLFAQNIEYNRVPVCGFFFEIYDKEEITDYYLNQYKRFLGEETYSIAIDVCNNNNLILTEIDNRVLYENNQYVTLWDYHPEMDSDTVYIYPKLSDKSLYEKCVFELLCLGKCDFIKNYALKISPLYAPDNSKKLFKCFYFKGTAIVKSIDKMDQKWRSLLLDSYAIGILKSKKYVLIIDDIHSYTPYILLENVPIWLPLNDSLDDTVTGY